MIDLWEWDGTNWTQRLPATSPPIRSHHMMTFDTARSVAVLFGGYHPVVAYLADTWEWNGTSWTQRFIGGFPPHRSVGGLAY